MVNMKSTINGSLTSGINIQDILDAFPFYVLLIDENHNILEANSAVKTYLGFEREDVIGKYCPQVIHGINTSFEGCPLEEAVGKNIAIERELFDKKTGRWVISAIYPIQGLTPKGKKIFLHFVTDITERKKTAEQLKKSREKFRRLSTDMESVREEEKRKIARDLHDETSQVLSSLHAYLETAIKMLPEDSDKIQEILKKGQTLSTTILDEIRKLIYELRPSMIEELGLVPAIQSLIERNLTAAGLKVRFKVHGRIKRLPPPVEICLFRVIQETTNNIIKHAQAKNVALSMNFTADHIKVRIKDDGIGFDYQVVTSADGTRGMGLLGMRERTEMIDGSLLVISSPGQGTEVTITVPLTSGVNDG